MEYINDPNNCVNDNFFPAPASSAPPFFPSYLRTTRRAFATAALPP